MATVSEEIIPSPQRLREIARKLDMADAMFTGQGEANTANYPVGAGMQQDLRQWADVIEATMPTAPDQDAAIEADPTAQTPPTVQAVLIQIREELAAAGTSMRASRAQDLCFTLWGIAEGTSAQPAVQVVLTASLDRKTYNPAEIEELCRVVEAACRVSTTP